MAVRDAGPDEIEALERLQRRASDVWEQYREQLAAHPDAISVSARAIAEGRTRVAGDPPVGFSVIESAGDDVWELDGLFVDPDRMGSGVGRELVADVVLRVRSAGGRRIEVTANPNALGFYAKVGFVAGEEVPTRFGPGIRMALVIKPDGAALRMVGSVQSVVLRTLLRWSS